MINIVNNSHSSLPTTRVKDIPVDTAFKGKLNYGDGIKVFLLEHHLISFLG